MSLAHNFLDDAPAIAGGRSLRGSATDRFVQVRAGLAARARAAIERAQTLAFDGACRAWSGSVGLLPQADPARYGIHVVRNLAYVDDAAPKRGDGDQLLDVYRPARRPLGVPLLYVHGGGFSRLSRQVYWIAALSLARRGFTVFTMDHRRAPAHRYPSAHEDVARAALWVRANAARFGADPDRLVLAGDSSGANLVTSLAVATAVRSSEPWARAIFDAGLAVRGVAAACGFFEVLDTSRYQQRSDIPEWIRDSIAAVGRDYRQAGQSRGSLLDPVVTLEHLVRQRGAAPRRPLPPFFVGVGDRDPVADDSRRLAAALRLLDVRCQERVYAGGVHGFHYLFPWHRRSIRCWSDQARFLRRCTEMPTQTPSTQTRLPETHRMEIM